MSGLKSSHGGLTRRGFLKTAGAVGALGLTGAVGMTSVDGWLVPARAAAEAREEVKYIFHNQHCGCRCNLKCTTRDGRLVLVEPHQVEDKHYEKICARGLSEIEHIYSAKRIQTPLKRVGERGEGKFAAISWDEALDEIASNIKAVQEKYGKESLLVMNSIESMARRTPWLPYLLGAQAGGFMGLDKNQANGMDRAFSVPARSSKSPSSIYSWSDASFILNFSNVLETGVTWTDAFFEAQDAGTKIVTVDPRYSVTASKSDQWIPIKPGTDLALVLGMIKRIVDEELYDVDFMRKNTSFPFLVSKSTGLIVKQGEGEAAAPLVWDEASGSAKPYNGDGVEPSLFGEFELDGELCATEFSLLVDQTQSYSLEWAVSETGVSRDVIISLADEYVKGPSIINIGYGGTDKVLNGDILGHAFAVLAALTGNSGKPGTGVGFYFANSGLTHYASLKAWPLPKGAAAAPSPVPFFNMCREDNSVRACIFFGDQPAQRQPGAAVSREWLKGLDFLAMVDMYYTSSASYMDIILPACSKFEFEEEISGVTVVNNYVEMSQKVLDPIFESHSDFWIECELCRRLGFEDFLPESSEALVRYQLQATSANMEGITFEALEQNEYMMRLKGSEVMPQKWLDQKYDTATGKIELYYEDMIDFNQALPVYEEPYEINEGNPLSSDYPFVFNQVRSRFRIHSSYTDAAWIQQFYEPCVEMNPDDAAERGMADGDLVEVFNANGSYKTHLRLSENVRPGSLAAVESSYESAMEEGILQSVTTVTVAPRTWKLAYGPQLAFCDLRVAVRKA